jgi:hypothetical protein
MTDAKGIGKSLGSSVSDSHLRVAAWMSGTRALGLGRRFALLESTMANDNGLLPLAEAIAGLRAQIRTAAIRARNVPAEERFRITEVELELTIVAEDSLEGCVGASWWVFKASANVVAKDVVTHKVRLKLEVGDGDVEVGSNIETR